MKGKLKLAFEATSGGYSPDRVVADPDLNRSFLAACRQFEVLGADAALNRALLNLRKRGELRGLHSIRTSFPFEEQYRFASEMAARFIERRDAVTLDAIICDPELANEFDQFAERLAPGFKAVEYRWAALNLRKLRRLKPELLSRVVQAPLVDTYAVAELEINRIPCEQGLYILFTRDSVLYIGEAENLNSRIRKHLDHSDNKGFARWMWEQGSSELFLEIHLLPSGTTTRIRKALEIELIRSRNPTFNVIR